MRRKLREDERVRRGRLFFETFALGEAEKGSGGTFWASSGEHLPLGRGSQAMSLKEALGTKKFIVTCEIHLPYGKSAEDYFDEISHLWGRVDGVRFHPFSADAAVSDSLSLCRLLRAEEIRSRVPGWDTRSQSPGNTGSARPSVLCGCGESSGVYGRNYRMTGDSMQEMMFFHVDVGKFFSVIDSLKKGIDVHGKDLDGEKDFFIGSGVDACGGGNAPDMEIREWSSWWSREQSISSPRRCSTWTFSPDS